MSGSRSGSALAVRKRLEELAVGREDDGRRGLLAELKADPGQMSLETLLLGLVYKINTRRAGGGEGAIRGRATGAHGHMINL